jgi:uncharacterized OsmC-like protein
MTTLNEYLAEKREAIAARKADIAAGVEGPTVMTARVRAEGRSGIRRIRIRDFQVISDSEADFAGYNLGPSSPELQLGVLGSCVTHVFLIQAAMLGVPLDSVETEVTATIDVRAGSPGFENIPFHPHDIRYTTSIVSSAAPAEIDALHEAVEHHCPILSLLRNPQEIVGEVRLTQTQAAARPALVTAGGGKGQG